MPTKIPRLVGHRGWPAQYPENTVEGFAAAAEKGAHWLECDVQLSSDGIPFVVHDVSLTRTAGINRHITDMSAAELAEVTVSERRRFGGRYTEAKLPRLQTLIDWLETQPQANLFVEIKRQSLRRFGHELVVREVLNDCRRVPNQCTIISFDHVSLDLARARGAMTIGWASEENSPETFQVVQTLDPDYLFTSDEMFADMYKSMPGPWQWVVYESQDPNQALQLAAQGAEFVETNDIGTMLDSMKLSES